MSIKKFLRRFLFLTSPIITILVFFSVVDVFMLFYPDVRTAPFPGFRFTALSQNLLSVNLYNNQRESEKYDAFIFGNSRSRAFQGEIWSTHLKDERASYHFGAGGAGLYDTNKKIRYLDELGDTIKHALVVVDEAFLVFNTNNEALMQMTPPQVSKESTFCYYLKFYRLMMDVDFVRAYFDFLFFRTYRPYMKGLIIPPGFKGQFNFVNGDIVYPSEALIAADSSTYYQRLIDQGEFFQRPVQKEEQPVTEAEITQLMEMKAVFDRHQTDYKIIISPTYDQVPLAEHHRQLLVEIFGDSQVYNFSGKHSLSEPLGNFSESIHYRPHVGTQILKQIYREE